MQKMCCIVNSSFPASYYVLMIVKLFYQMMSLLLLLTEQKIRKTQENLFQPVLVVYSGKIYTVLQSYFVYMRRSFDVYTATEFNFEI